MKELVKQIILEELAAARVIGPYSISLEIKEDSMGTITVAAIRKAVREFMERRPYPIPAKCDWQFPFEVYDDIKFNERNSGVQGFYGMGQV